MAFLFDNGSNGNHSVLFLCIHFILNVFVYLYFNQVDLFPSLLNIRDFMFALNLLDLSIIVTEVNHLFINKSFIDTVYA